MLVLDAPGFCLSWHCCTQVGWNGKAYWLVCEEDHETTALGIGTAMVVQCGCPLDQTCAQGGGCWVLFTLHVDRPDSTWNVHGPITQMKQNVQIHGGPFLQLFSHASWRYQWMTSWQGHLATCAVLLKASADPQLVCSQGRTALHHACAGASRPRDLRAGWSARGFLRRYLKLFKVREWDVHGLIGFNRDVDAEFLLQATSWSFVTCSLASIRSWIQWIGDVH